MKTQHELDRRLGSMLEDGASRAPRAPIDAALAHALAHPRRRDPLAFLRRDPMTTQPTRLAAAMQPAPLAAAIVVVLAASLVVATGGGPFRDQATTGLPIATPSSTASATPASGSPLPSSPAPSGAPASDAVPESPRVITVDLIEHVGANATIDITDLSGTLVSAVSGDPGDGASVPGGAVSAVRLAADPATLVLTWSGLPCDTTHRLTIESDGVTMTIERPACQGDALGVDHVLRLTFDHPVDQALIHATIRTVGR